MIVDPENFCLEVERLHAHHGMSMFESIFLVCEKFNIDYELVGPLINRSIKDKLKQEAIKRKLIKGNVRQLFFEK